MKKKTDKVIALCDVLKRDQIFLDPPGKNSKQDLLEFLSCQMARGTEKASDDFLQALQFREDEMSTGIGFGIGIPHARFGGLTEPRLIFVRSREGISRYDSLDGKPVQLIFALATDPDRSDIHCGILSKLSILLTNPHNRELLLCAQTNDDVLALFSSFAS